jgi:TRAP-type uncharacterized transport system substrate-binding protein
MEADDATLLSRRERFRMVAIVVVLVIGALAVSLEWLRSAPPRRIVIASGPEFGVYHQHAKRYQKILARDGVRVEERMTDGAQENLKLLLDPKSGVDVAFMQGGVATFPAADGLVMLASLYYEPIWRSTATRAVTDQAAAGKRIAMACRERTTRHEPDPRDQRHDFGGGTRNTDLVAVGNDALAALRAGEVDARLRRRRANATIQAAMREPSAKLLSVARADAYPRRYTFLTKLVLPPGTVDLALDVPDRQVALIGTKAMLAARDDFHPALINLLIEAAREIHGEQGYFEAAGEFPGIAGVDLRVSPHADQHKRFGPSILYQYMPFWAATYVEKAIILLLPLMVVIVPLMNFLPQILRWRAQSRIYRWYGQLALLERELAIHKNGERTGKWLDELDRIDRSVGRAKTPAKFASEAYTLRDHISIVRRAVLARVDAPDGPPRPPSGLDSPQP